MFSHAQIQNQIANVEQFLNPIDWMPYVSPLSGMVRILAAEVEIAAGLAFMALKVCQSLLDGKMETFREARQGVTYINHGFCNIIRGAIAMLPWVHFLLLVNDYKLGRVNYEFEKMRPGVYPLTTAYRDAKPT